MNQPKDKVVRIKKIKNDSQGIFTKLGQIGYSLFLCLVE